MCRIEPALTPNSAASVLTLSLFQFIEICRREDASGKLRRIYEDANITSSENETRAHLINCDLNGHRKLTVSCRRPDQKEQKDQPDKVQGAVQAQPLHPGAQGFRQGRQAEAEPSS